MEERDSTLKREDCEYTSCYCEENMWQLCESFRKHGRSLDQLSVVFISNDNRTVPLWKQQSGRGDQPVVWDYHVILIETGLDLVYDLDSVLPFPCALTQYTLQAFRTDRDIKPLYHRKLRVVPASCFLSNFASDRSHMINPDGTFKMAPPPYPPIRTNDSIMNLDDFISMKPDVGFGSVYTLEQFTLTYTHNKT